MKLIAYLIMTVCLCLGTLSATVAYAPKVSLDDDVLVGATLNSPAGVVDQEAEQLEPIAAKGVTVTPELLSTLRAADVQRIRVKEFSFARWDMAWLMGVSCIGLAIAAFMVKMATRKEIAAELAAPTDHEDSPGKSLDRVAETVAALRRDIEAASDDHAKNEMIIDRVGSLQRNELATLANSRTTLVAMLTLTGYAHFMDRFSMMERLLNRAWSAAADEVTAEAELSLREANELMPDVLAAMKK
jgi:hypothetical protein